MAFLNKQDKLLTFGLSHAVFLLCFCGFLIRVLVFLIMEEYVGDGPTRALQGYMWSADPFWVTHGWWLPLHRYLSGIMNIVWYDPVSATRIMNLILGTLTIYVFYHLCRRLFDKWVGLLSACFVAFYPLHIALSVTSLTAVHFCFWLVTALYFYFSALSEDQTKNKFWGFMVLSILCLSCANMIRYESWALTPFLAFYLLIHNRTWKPAILFAGLSSLPLIGWLISNVLVTGELYPMTFAIQQMSIYKAPGLVYAVLKWFELFQRSVGWGGILIFFPGLVMILCSLSISQFNEKKLYAFLVILYWTFLAALSSQGKTVFESRYILTPSLLAIPIGAYVLTYLIKKSWKLAVVSIVCVGLLTGVAFVTERPLMYLRSSKPPYVIEIIEWIKTSGFENESLIMGEMAWEGTQIALDLRIPGGTHNHYFIAATYMFSNQDVKNYLTKHHPRIAIFSLSNRKKDIQSKKLVMDACGELTIHSTILYKTSKFEILELTYPERSRLQPQGSVSIDQNT